MPFPYPTTKVFRVLLISPLVGFGCAALLMLTAKLFIKYPALFEAPKTHVPCGQQQAVLWFSLFLKSPL